MRNRVTYLWRTWRDIALVFDGPADSEWGDDRQTVDQQLDDPRPQR